MVPLALLGLFMFISHIPTILFLMMWSYGTIQVYKLFLEDLVPLDEQTIQKRQKMRDESQQKINEFWNALTGSEEGEPTSLQSMKENTEEFIQSVVQDPPAAAKKISIALRKKTNVE